MRTQWPDEPLCRAQFHLARVIRLRADESDFVDDPDHLETRLTEAATLDDQARETLNRLLQHHIPDYLRDAEDELALFDHLQATFRGRWTGLTLLQNIPAEPGKAMAEG